MAKGDVFPSEKRAFTEPSTGVHVVQLTDHPAYHANPYYNEQAFIGDSERYVFRSNRAGAMGGELFMVEVKTGRIVQMTEPSRSSTPRPMTSHGSGRLTADPHRGIVYTCRDRQVIGIDVETLSERIVAETPKGCTALGGLDLSSCGRYLVAGCRPEGADNHYGYPGMRYRHGSENMVVLIDIQDGRQAIIYHGPSPENQAAPDSHAYISRGDPSYPFFGSYTRRQPSGAKTLWAMRVDLDHLEPVRDPMPLFDQRPSEQVNHYYPAPNGHVESLMWAAEAYDRHGAPAGIHSHRLGMLLDVDLVSGSVARWAFPGRSPIHCKCNHAVDMWAGDCADPGFLWFAGRDRPFESGDHPHHWDEADKWIGVFKKRGPYLEVRPLVRHDTDWPAAHPHPVFSPDDRWIAYRSGDRTQTQIFLAEAVWPKWFW